MEIIKWKKIMKWKIIRRWKKKRPWGTKSFDIWLALNVLLQLSKPKNILEFGGGKSTRYFAEFTKASGANLLTIEESPVWLKRIKGDLKHDQLNPDVVSLVPLANNWYNIQTVESLTKDLPWDFLLIDGPAKQHPRDSIIGTNFLEALSKNLKTVVVDDLHRINNMARFHKLLMTRNQTGAFFMAYSVGKKPNLIGFMGETETMRKTMKVLSSLEIEYIKSYESALKLVWE